MGGLHLSAFAAGMIAAGLTGDRLLQVLGRRIVFWGGAAGMAFGACLLAVAGHVLVTLGATLIMGSSGAVLLVTIQAALSDHHGASRAIAFTEANVAGGVSAGLAPLLVGGFQHIGLGWRAALFAAAALLAVLLVCCMTEPVPDQSRAQGHLSTAGRLPVAFWAYWIVILLSVAIEFCMIAWGAEFLEGALGLRKNVAAAAMSVFFGAMVLGRLVGSRLAHHIAARRLLKVAVVINAAGFPLFWLAQAPVLALLGLFVTGLGIGNLFPLTLSVALDVAGDQLDVASARVTLGAGLAICTAPLALGSIADQMGIKSAYGATLVLIAAIMLMLRLARRVEVA